MHAHELEAAGKARWSAKYVDGLLMVTDEASDEEVQATAFTSEGDGIRFSLPGENGLRFLALGAPGYDAFKAVIERGPAKAPAALTKAKTA